MTWIVRIVPLADSSLSIVPPQLERQTPRKIAPRKLSNLNSMTKQEGTSMRTKLFAIAVCLLGGVVSTHAQAGGLKVNVPFDFEVANKTLPAGEYVIRSQREL